MTPDMVLAADLNPGDSGTPALTTLTLNSSAADMRQGNSTNHARAGENVLYVDGRVEWATTPFAGKGSDNMYTRAATANPVNRAPLADQSSDAAYPFGQEPPTHAADTILLPTETSTGLLPF